MMAKSKLLKNVVDVDTLVIQYSCVMTDIFICINCYFKFSIHNGDDTP